jgi:hypothetical protein
MEFMINPKFSPGISPGNANYRNKREEHIISYFEWQKLGDYDVWPFFRKTDYQDQLTNRPFLGGQRATGA